MEIPAEVVAGLRAARHICVLTGAGASAESGVPTFREAQAGLWEQYDPLELATPEAFLRDPKLVWQWYAWRRELISRVEPNAGHHALVELARISRQFTLVTQNVDELHQRAGSEYVVEFHGNIFNNRCFDGNCDVGDADTEASPPKCPHCGGYVRPGVVWFGEQIPSDALELANNAAVACDVFMSIGTSSHVWPAAGLADAARQNGAMVVEINPDVTSQSSHSRYRLAGKSGVILPELVRLLAHQ